MTFSIFGYSISLNSPIVFIDDAHYEGYVAVFRRPFKAWRNAVPESAMHDEFDDIPF